MTTKKKMLAIIIVVSVILLCVICAKVYNSPEQQMLRTCKDFGLENTKVRISFYTNYGGYAFYQTTVHCDGFSALDEPLFNSFFYEIGNIDAEHKIFSGDTTTVYSDGGVYTSKLQEINGENIRVIYIDGKAMDERYDESNKVKCTKCNGVGSYSCSDCNGHGKRAVNFYSEGNWGFESYSNYECTDCNGRGRIDCSRCYGEGYYYDMSGGADGESQSVAAAPPAAEPPAAAPPAASP